MASFIPAFIEVLKERLMRPLISQQEIQYEKVVENFRKQETELIMATDRLQTLGEKRSKEGEDWLAKAQYVLEDIQKLKNEIEEYKRSWIRYVSNPHLLIWKVKKKMAVIKVLLETYKYHIGGDRASLRATEFLPKDNLLSTSESFRSAFEKIMEALKDGAVCMIAVWGMAGAGKTTLVKEVEEKAREKEIFDQIIKVVVSESTPNPEKIQEGIAAFLQFKIRNTEMRRAEQLWHRLKTEKTILIILDGLWDEINLKDIGIPYGEDHNGCKILLTTRSEQVCISMRIQKVIRLDVLSDDEAFRLFQMNAGDPSDSPETISRAATEIAEECKGLPSALVELGRRLRGKRFPLWEITSLKLRSPRFEDGECFGPLERTYQGLRLSYSHLKKRTTKSCFLLCSLFPQDYAIDVEVLTRYAWGLGLYEGIDSINKVRYEVWEAVENLISSCLLLEHEETSVKMHNLVRRCAIWIASQEKISFMIGLKIGLKEWQKVEDLPERFVCEELEILSLDGNGCRTISTALMEGLKSLKVFTLHNGYLSACALVNLTNLRTLHLVCCQIDDISLLGKLGKLEILSFRGSNILKLPEEIGGLKYLRSLDLFDCENLQNVPLNLIQKLSQLEELYFEKWWLVETSSEGSMARPSAHSEIISSCSLPPKLQMYEIAIKEDGSSSDNHSPTSRILRLYARSPDTFQDSFPTARRLHLNHVTEKQPAVGQSAKELRVEDCDMLQVQFPNDGLRNISQKDESMLRLSNSTLELIELPQLTCIWNGSTGHVSLRSLKIVIIKDCRKLTSLFSLSLARRMVSLEKLRIDGCHALKQIIPDTYLLCLPTLVTLEITDCGSLEYVFQITTASFAPKLKVLNISRCPRMNRVIVARNQHNGLPQLQRLALKKLGSLTSFCSGEFSIGLPSLEELEVEACPQLLSIREIVIPSKVKDLCLFNVGNQLWEEVTLLEGGYFLSSMEKLTLKEVYELQVIWKDPSQLVTLQHLSHLIVSKCNKLRYIFSVLHARNLLQLCRLQVQGCEELEQLIVHSGSSSSLARQKPACFPNLKQISIMECNKLKILFPFSVSRLPKLEKLEVKDASNLREIFGYESEANMTKDVNRKQKNVSNDEKLREVLLPELKVLFLENLPNFIRFATVGYYFVFPALNSLRVNGCSKIIMEFTVHDDSAGLYVQAQIEKSKLHDEGNMNSSITMEKINPISDEVKNIAWDRHGKNR